MKKFLTTILLLAISLFTIASRAVELHLVAKMYQTRFDSGQSWSEPVKCNIPIVAEIAEEKLTIYKDVGTIKYNLSYIGSATDDNWEVLKFSGIDSFSTECVVYIAVPNGNNNIEYALVFIINDLLNIRYITVPNI